MTVQPRARSAAMTACTVTDVSAEKCGWDITAQPPVVDGVLPEARHIEVKGWVKGADTITVTRNEIWTALNQDGKFWLAIVLVDGDAVEGPHYVPQPFTQEPELDAVSVNFPIASLLATAVPESA